MTQVAVCVITFRRPIGLRRLLESLNRLVLDDPLPQIRIIVVENEASGPGEAVCNELRPKMRWPIEYHVEPRRGIPFARNKAVACVRDQADFLAFVDDDEEAEPNWLNALLRVRSRYGADVVTGPVLPRFEEPVPPWIEQGRFFERQRFRTGAMRDRAFTNNVLFRSEVFERLPAPFDERMALSGGSDTHFSRRLHRAGITIVWADEAVVYDWLPATRTHWRWILRRSYRIGASTAFIELDILPRTTAVLRLLLGAGTRLAEGILLLLYSLVSGRAGLVQSGSRLCYGAGMLAGMFGARYDEYQQTHGV